MKEVEMILNIDRNVAVKMIPLPFPRFLWERFARYVLGQVVAINEIVEVGFVTKKEWNIIKEYTDHYKLRPRLSVPSAGQFAFSDASGKELTVSMQQMKHEVEAMRGKDRQS